MQFRTLPMRNCHMDADTFNRRHPTRQITGGNLTENTEKKIDLNDGDPWSEAHVSDLWASLEYGDSIEEAARFLCRSGTIDDVRRKADELGLKYVSKPLPPPAPTHKITKAEVIELPEGRFGVAYKFDDGESVTVESDSKEMAEFDARDRIGDPVPIWVRPRDRQRGPGWRLCC